MMDIYINDQLRKWQCCIKKHISIEDVVCNVSILNHEKGIFVYN